MSNHMDFFTLMFSMGLTIRIVYGGGCFTEPKIFIVKLSIEDQVKLLASAKKQCNLLKQMEFGKDKHVYCNRTFDGIMCWPPAEAGTVVQQPCPNYVNNFYTKAMASRKCMSTADWYVNPNTSKTWTNYSACMVQPPTERPHIMLENISKIQLMYRIGYSASLASLVIAIFLMIWFRKLHCHRNTIHINLFLSFALRAVVIFVKDAYVLPDGLASFQNETATINASGSNWHCKLVISLFNYLLVANYMWIFNEGLYLHTVILVATFKPTKIFNFCLLFGWLSPLLVVIPWVLVRRYLEDTLCWSTYNPDLKFHWIIRGPIVVSIAINFLFFINIIRVLFTKLTASQSTDPHRYRRLARSTLVLIPLFGVHYMLTIAMPDCMEQKFEVVWLYLESGINSFQGLLIAILFCFLNGEVKTEISKRWTRHVMQRLSCMPGKMAKTLIVGSSVSMKEKISPNSLCMDNMMKEQCMPLNGHSITLKDSNARNKNKFMERINGNPTADKEQHFIITTTI